MKTINSELAKIFGEAAKRAKEKGNKDVLLETVFHQILNFLENENSVDEKFNAYVKEIKKSPTLDFPKFCHTVIGLIETAEGLNTESKNPSIVEIGDKANKLPASADLDETMTAATELMNKFHIEGEMSLGIFFLAALQVDNPLVRYFKKAGGFDTHTLVTNLLWSEDIEKLNGEWKEKTITAGNEANKGTETDESESNAGDSFWKKKMTKEDEHFQKAGEKGSISTKAIDPNSKTPFLDEFAYDMTKAAAEGKYDPVIGRERELGSLIEILACRKKNNAILLGEPGCGKTSVVEALVEKIAKKDVPYSLQSKRVVSLDLNALVAGAIYRGEYEKRLQGIIKEVVETGNIIVFIDEVHNLIGNGSSTGQGDGANILKPYLARGEFQIIGATTKTEYRVIEKDGALKRRFQNVVVEDPGIKETIDILSTVSEMYSRYHKVVFSPKVLEVCAKWSDKYISDRHQPDKSIDLLDMSGALCKLKSPRDEKESKLEDELKEKIDNAVQEKIKAVTAQDFEVASKWRDDQKKLEKELEKYIKKTSKIDKTAKIDKTGWPEVSIDDVAEVLSKITNIPVDKIKSTDSAKIKELKESLLTNIIGQDEAIDKVVKTLQLGILGIRDPKRPLCSFLLCGPSGTGKTYLAKLLAKYYYGNENAMVRINMGEMDEHSKARLLGSQPGTIGYDEPTPFDELATRPASVVLLDEVEKADAKIFDVILNAIGEEGYITLNNGKDISFRQSIVILTSNIGTKELAAKGGGLGFSKAVGEEKKKEDSNTVMKAIKKFFRPEFLNRLTGISVFNELSMEDMKKIFDLELKKMNERTEESGHIIEVGEKMKKKIIEGVDTKFGARDLTRKIMELISNDVCEEMIKAGDKVKKTIRVDLDKEGNTVVKFKGK